MFAKAQPLKFRIKAAALIGAVSTVVWGCAPLQQAPLVYTSSHVVGVKLGMAPTQPESLEVVVGYKDLDAAYAPVAVSNPYLDEAIKPGNKYDKELYEIKEIYGIYGTQATAEAASQLLTADESNDMKLFFEAYSGKKTSESIAIAAESKLNDARSLNELSESIKAELEKPGSCTKFSLSTTVSKLVEELLSCTGKEEDKNEVSRLYSGLKDSNQTLIVTRDALKAAQQEKDKTSLDLAEKTRIHNEISSKVKKVLEKLASIQKRDAISVYGSFDADTVAGTNEDGAKPLDGGGVNVKIGKVFSTGVAAQNISEAQKIVASSVVVGSCIKAIGDHAAGLYPNESDMTVRQNYVKGLMAECLKSTSQNNK
ncbi:MAG TPA: hypothetical protein VJA19_02830 [Pseudomonas sp.]|nr:hypothetical protein [Pseudomonas sp.]